MKTIYKGHNFVIQWSIMDAVTSLPFDFNDMFVEFIVYSDNYKGRISGCKISGNKMQAEIMANTLPVGVYDIVCSYKNSMNSGHCICRRAFNITRNPEFCSNTDRVVIESYASPLKLENMDINYLGHFPSEEVLPDSDKPAWALVGTLKFARPWFFYTANVVPPGFQTGWNDLSEVLGTYDLTADKVSIFDFNLVTEYNVSRNHPNIKRDFSNDWGMAKGYYPEYDEYQPYKVYQKGGYVNMPEYTEHTFIALCETSEAPFVVTSSSNEFTLEEALDIVPDEYRFPGIKITFANSETKKAETYYWLGGDWYSTERWVVPKGDNGLPPRLAVIGNKLHYSYDNENWVVCSDFIAHYFRIKDNKLQISPDNVNWEIFSDYIAAYFRFNSTFKESNGATIGNIQISRDNKNWQDLSPEFVNHFRISAYVSTKGELPTNKPVGTMYGVGPTYKEEDTARVNPIYRIYVYDGTNWIDNGSFTSIAAGIVQETGDSENAVMSQKAVTVKFDEHKGMFSELNKEVNKVDSKVTDFQNNFLDENNESLYITDINGNIIAEIGKEGITTTALFVKDENAIKNLLEMLKEIQNNDSDSDGVEDILPIEDDALYVTDKNYNIFLSIAKNKKGEYVFDYAGKGREAEVGNCLYGKNIYSLGDSLSVGGDWQKRLCELTGAKFDSNLNYQNFSYGGTATYSGLNSGRDRAKKLVEYAKKGNQVDYVFLENVNDINKVGTEDISTEGLPLMLGDVISFTDMAFGTYTECITYFRENINSIIGGITPKVGSEIILYYSGEKTSTNIKVLGSPQKSGQITINVGGRSYGIQVTANMTTKEVVNKILEYSYEGYTDELASDGVSVTFTALDASTSAEVSFVDTDSTGLEVSLSITGAASKVTLTYGSLSLTTESWLNGDNWNKNYGSESWSTETLARVYKGLIEYLQKELPTAKLIWIIPTRCSYNHVNGAKRADGTLDYEAAYNSESMVKYRKLCDFQKKMCAMYGIDCIDLSVISGISFVNAYPIFYPNSNVHPNLAGYERWGECISRVLTGI